MTIHLDDYEAGADYDGKYKADLKELQKRLERIQVAHIVGGTRAIVMFEGWDAAGKGGIIQRLSAEWDPRNYKVWPIAAPTADEKAHHFLWRFWKRLPANGHIAVFDRSWYGRVLVERVEKLCSEQDWMRAYHEINDFEEQIVEASGVVTKFWLTITKDEQLRRFRERQKTSFKNFKITPEDWRNRKRWDDYEAAVCDMVERTSNDDAPWILVPANDKYSARIQVLKTLCERIEASL